MRATDSLLSTTVQFKILNIPTASNGTTYGPGSASNFMVSNGTSVYWTNTVGNLTIGGTVNTIPGKSISSNDALYLASGSNSSIIFKRSDTIYIQLDTNNNFRPETTNQIYLGDSTHRWKGLFLEGQSSATSEGIQFYSGTTLYARIGADTTTGGLGIYGSAHLWFKPSLSDATLGFEVDSTAVYPTTTQKHSLGKTDKLWTTIYSNSLVSTYLNINTAAQTAYNVYVNGTSYFNGNVTHNGYDYFANGTTYYIDNSGTANLYGLTTNYDAIIKGSITINNAADEPIISFKGSNNTNAWGSFGMARNTPGDGDLYSDHRFRFLNRSYATDDNSYISYYEYFDLPAVNADRVDNASYNILTTKYTVTTAQGGTGNTSYTASRILYTSSATQFSSGTLVTDGSYLSRAGVSKSQINGRDNAIIKTTSYSGYDAILSMKTTNGAWELGVYTSNKMYFTYTPDSNYNASNNTGYIQVSIASDGTVTAPAFSGSFGAGNITGTLAIGHGGTGATSANDAIKNLATGVTVASGDFTDSTYMITNNNSGDTSTWYRRSATSMWNYIADKGDSRWIKSSGATITGTLTMYNSGSGDTPALVFQRASIGDNYWDWRIVNSSGTLYFQANEGSGWTNRVSFYQNTITAEITGNASSATKLQNSRTIWGQSFNGTANIAGHLYLTGAVASSSTSNTTQIVFGTSSNNHVCVSSNTHCLIINPTTSSTTNQIDLYLDTYSIFPSGVKNAVWNDFAEFRAVDTNEPGYAVIPTETGIATKTTARLQPGAHIISDTYGMAVGESDQAKTPLGMAGRVLAYPYRSISEYHLGDVVCTAPNGTVDIMTREEIMTYPECIIGIVNEIPLYEIWEQTYTNENGAGQTVQKIHVNGRIWIDIK